MTEMTHWERIRATVNGQETDRLGVSMWRHFYDQENDPDTLAEAMLDFQKNYDWDFMKVNARASYHMEDWGLKTKYNNGRKPPTVDWPIKKPQDWSKLEALNPEEGALGEQLKALELIEKGLGGEVPFIMTVFTPPSIASRLIDPRENFAEHLRQNYDEVRYALEIITDTSIRFCRACLNRGVSGFFLPIAAWANTAAISGDDYAALAMPYDLKLLNTIAAADFNLLHVCGNNNLLHIVKDYPVHAFNWEARGAGNPSIMEGKGLIGKKVAVGGMPAIRKIVSYSPQELLSEAVGMRVALGSKGWILSPGCVFAGATPVANVEAIRKAVESPPG